MIEHIQLIGRFLFYVLLPALMLWRPRHFLYWLPFTPMAGLWVESLNLGHGNSHLSSYVETILVVWLLAAWFTRLDKTRTSLFLLGLPLLALPSFLHSSGHAFFSLFFFVGLLAGPGVHAYFQDNLKDLTEGPHIDRLVTMWNVLTMAIRFYEVATAGGLFLEQRGGGIWASNHYGGIILLLLPMVRSRWVVITTLAVMSIQFSRGIYLALVVFGLCWALLVNWRPVAKAALAAVAALAVTWISLPAPQKRLVEFMVIERFAFQGMELGDIKAETVMNRGLQDERFNIHRTALEIVQKTGWMGTGLGGFYFGMEDLGHEIKFSNAHNLYLTALGEGGLAFAAGVCGLIGWALILALKRNRRSFAGLMAWACYGLYSGELYEAARYASCMDYYYFLLLLAWAQTRPGPAFDPPPAPQATP